MEGVGEGLFCSSGILARDGLPLGLSEETQRESRHPGTGSQERDLIEVKFSPEGQSLGRRIGGGGEMPPLDRVSRSGEA